MESRWRVVGTKLTKVSYGTNGPGLTAEEQTRLFKPFSRLQKIEIEGDGLGLSIVRCIVEKLGGQAGVDSAGVPGQGSEFWFAAWTWPGP